VEERASMARLTSSVFNLFFVCSPSFTWLMNCGYGFGPKTSLMQLAHLSYVRQVGVNKLLTEFDSKKRCGDVAPLITRREGH
jgi:hypothetical protein